MSHPRSAQRELAAKTRFENDTKDHQMKVLHDEGLYRHLRFKVPGSSFYWFDVITWPGGLTLTGDMGTWTFARTEDMFEFFRDCRGLTRINPGYWAEKLQNGASGGYRQASEYDGDLLAEHLRDRAREHAEDEEWPERIRDAMLADLNNTIDLFEDDLRSALHDADQWSFTRQITREDANEWFADWTDEHDVRFTPGRYPTYEFEFSWDDLYDHGSYETYMVHFLWCCWAIVHAITTYDAHKAAEAEPVADFETSVQNGRPLERVGNL